MAFHGVSVPPLQHPTLDFETLPRVNDERVSVTWRFACKDEEVASNSGFARAQRCAQFEVRGHGNPNMKRFLCSFAVCS